ncbi:MAG TPA: TonB-dependent receptor [Ignavibacteriales bacterium]|nr:TonB-dependent receptor [Ignavibacteriales bacterium]
MAHINLPGFLFIFFLILSCILLPPHSAETFAQSGTNLRGLVTDSTSGEALTYASVTIKEISTGAYSDSKGYFLITSVPAGRPLTVVVSYMGYYPKKMTVSLEKGKMKHLDIKMIPTSVFLPTVEKVEKRFVEENATDISLQRLTIKELELMPKGVETDIFRSLQYLPGVRSTGDVSARYYIRGGASNQNLVMINGATIYNPFHAFGLFSIVDPEMVNNIEFYKGGFTSEYGGRLSSVMNIFTKDGNKNNYSAKAGISYLSAKALVEGPIPDGSFIITGRKSYSSDIYGKFLNGKNIPLDFYDLSFKINYSNPEFVEGSKITVQGLLSSDRLLNHDPMKADLKWANSIFGFRWFQLSDSPLFFEMGVSFSNFLGEIIPNLSTSRPERNEVSDLNMKIDCSYVYDSKDELGAGLNITRLNTKLFLENSSGLITDIGSFGNNFSVYAKYKFLRFRNLGIDLGTRINLTGLSSNGGGYFNEPRISFTYRFIPQIALKGAWGIFQQEITTLSDESEVISLFEPWVIIPEYLDPARAKHFILGIETNFTEYLSLETEGYYKKMENLPAINERKIFDSDPDLVSGWGEAYGFECMLKYKFLDFYFMGSYSLGWAYKNVNNWLYYPKYDSRHSVNLTLEYDMGRNWQASIVWVYNSGLPFTKITGYYDKLEAEDYFSQMNLLTPYLPFLLLGDKNLGRLPDYHRMDVSLSKKFSIAFANFYLDLSVVNVYNRKNIFYFERDTGRRVNMLPFLPTATLKLEI